MKKSQFAIFTLITCIFSAIIFASCDTNPRPHHDDEPGVVTGVILSLDNLVIAPGEYTTLTATVLPTSAPDQRVKWTSSNHGVATVDYEGKVTGIAAGQAAITVTTMDDNFMAQCAVTVEANYAKVTNLSLSPASLPIVYGKSAILEATVNPADGAVKWTSSDPDIAAVSQNGTVTAKSEGEANITVTAENGGKSAECAVTVTVTVPVDNVTLNLSTLNIAPGDSPTLTAVVSPANATDKRLTWTSSDTAVATVDTNGRVTGKTAGSATITVSSKEDSTKTATCTVTVTSGGTQVTGVILNTNPLTINKGSNGTLTATVSPSGASTNFSWISSNTDVATVTWNGATATVAGVAGGSATITVSTVNGGCTANCVVTVTVNIPVTGVSLDHTKIMVRSSSGSTIISQASKAQLSATVLPTDATNKNVTWKSDNSAVAAVDQNGMVIGKAVGNATITVSSTEDSTKKDTCVVTVYGHFAVTNASEWAGALSSISTAPDGIADSTTVFIIEIRSSFGVPGISGSSIGGNYKEVRLTGSGTVALSSNGSLIRTAANQNFIIDGPTLQGKSGNNAALVYIAGGAMELRSGYISGNNNGGSYGGGVYVAGGNFTMTGGTISGNNASGSSGGGTGGGGVCVNGGNFTMTGGTISGNTAFGAGGGVRILTGNFTMTDGAIYGNEVAAPLKNTSNTAGAAVADDTPGPPGTAINSTIHKYP
ncbi:MAG: Ig-like domain-containing protein [Spirochaetaceae bacterium]|nr:Ig-like domain-containing protein [Spirochaetaceae bacterium]